ncbi:hypothetical protein NFI96_015045 [Prochilodus magdalenae]|nr:hypothetical protein NFI96_015045 [Prochilodus magdalenae]
MPSTRKILHFLSSALLCAAGVGILGYGISTDWVQSTLACAPAGTEEYNGSAIVQMTLFNSTAKKMQCPGFNSEEVVKVFDKLGQEDVGAAVLQGLVVGFLALALLGSAGSILITLFNTFSNPYENYLGPVGLFVCSGLSATLAFLALVLYLINVYWIKIAMKIANDQAKVNLKENGVQLLVGFYLLLPYIGLNLFAILLVYLYVHAAYTRRREQEKPTEDAPKDIMMF